MRFYRLEDLLKGVNSVRRRGLVIGYIRLVSTMRKTVR